jgi:beta-lactamase class A
MNTNLIRLEKNIINEFNSIEGKFALAFEEIDNSTNKLLINLEEVFHAASTMKTPVMMEVFKQANEGKFSLSDSVLIENEFRSIVDGSTYQIDLSEDSGEELYKFIGQKRTIYQLVYDMISVSSNLATNILIELVDAKNVTKTMREAGADKINVLRGVEDIKAYNLGLNNTITAKDLLVIFKTIASGNWISHAVCSQMQRILLDQKFKTKIPRLLPKDIKVAHKTGSISKIEHDSGIVFLPYGRKYVLVILSKELTDVKLGSDTIAKVSKMIYDYMVSD